MEQPTRSPGAQTDTWERLDADVRPTAAMGGETPRQAPTRRLGEVVGSLGDRLRSPAVTGRVAAADGVGRAFQRAGGYLDQRDVADIRYDAERIIIRRPFVSMLVAVVVGYLAGRAVWR
jgi:hypothetical protein